MAYLYNPLSHLIKRSLYRSVDNLRVCPTLASGRVISSRFIEFTTTPQRLHYTTTKPRTMAPSTIQGGIPWDLLIEFAKEKKAEEEQTGLPALLDKQQITAISSLISLIPEPDVPEGNWINTLSEYCQQNAHPLPHWPPSDTFSIIAHGVRLQRSRVSCQLPWCNQTFPQEGYGYEAGQDPPTFKQAKQAKQFAAMQAYNYIQTTRGNKRPASTTQGSPSRTRVKAEEDNSDGGVSTTAAPPQTSGPSSSAILIRERVASLAGQMNFGIPEYFIEQDGETWRGRPIFRNDGRIPEGVGAVSGYVDRQQAEDAVAEKVLEWLEKELEAKEAAFGKTLSQAGGQN